LSLSKTNTDLEEEKKLLETFNNQLCDRYKKQENLINALQQSVKDLNEQNDNLNTRNSNLSKEIRIYELRVSKLERATKAEHSRMSKLEKRIIDNEISTKELEKKHEEVQNKLAIPPKKRKRRKNPQV